MFYEILYGSSLLIGIFLTNNDKLSYSKSVFSTSEGDRVRPLCFVVILYIL